MSRTEMIQLIYAWNTYIHNKYAVYIMREGALHDLTTGSIYLPINYFPNNAHKETTGQPLHQDNDSDLWTISTIDIFYF